MSTVLRIAQKDLQLLLTDKVTLFFTFVFPLLFALLFGGIMGGGGKPRQLALAIVQEDQGTAASAFVQQLQHAVELKVVLLDRATAETAVRTGKQTAYLIVPDGFSQRWQQPFSGPAPAVQLGVDPAREAEAGLLQGVLMKYAANRFSALFSNSDAMPMQLNDAIKNIEADNEMPVEWRSLLLDYLPKLEKLSREQPLPTAESESASGFAGFTPLQIDEQTVAVDKKGPGNAYAVIFPQSMVWAVLGCLMGFGVSLVQERVRGTLTRLQIAPIPFRHVLLGKALACAFTQVLVMSLLMTVAHLFFNVPLPQPLALAAAVLAIALAFSGMMILLAALAPTEQAVNGMGWAVLMVLAMIGGCMIPLFLMPDWLQTISHISPIKWAILALEGAIWRGFSGPEMLLPLAILLAVGLLAYGSASWRMHRTLV